MNELSKKPHFIRHKLKDVFAITVVIEFVTNEYGVMALWAELALQPLLFLLVGVSVVARKNEEQRPVKRFADRVLALIGICLLTFGVYEVVTRWGAINKELLALQFFLPLWATIALLPYVYCLSLFVNYQAAFTRINFFASNRKQRVRAKVVLLLAYNMRTYDLGSFGGAWQQKLVQADGYRASFKVLREANRAGEQVERAKQEALERLVRYAGSDEVDVCGRRLDRREFKETTAALKWLATCQMGWYNNRGGRYRPDFLTMIGDDFTSYGLPQPSGITLRVAEDEQSWYAYRRTVTGWCFAIGAAGPPPDQWEFDGLGPPTGFPGIDSCWGAQPFSDSVNFNWTEPDWSEDSTA